MRRFDKVLVANRGEIALRIIRACRQLGIKTVAVYSSADKDSGHLRLADQQICIGPAPAKESYLNIAAILGAADLARVDAIHPGYGFLAENADFAQQVVDSGFHFIGPEADTIRLMGDKVSAIAAMKAAGVPTVPGSDGLLGDNEAQSLKVAAQIGYPLIIKATAGGGGKGMRVVENEAQLLGAIALTRQEAEAAFGNGGVYLEKYLTRPRHIEVQVLCDHQGHCISLGERDCSLQRAQQKVIESAPAPGLTPEQRQQISESCIKACQAIGYRGAGTLEFLYQDGEFYFMEMNTRIQVEHTITEMVTGVDLLVQQLRVAQGESLALQESLIQPQGHAIECRINAEDPASFAPSPGRIDRLVVPGGLGVRWESHLSPGASVPPYYDAMIAKLIAWGDDRAQAIARMRTALDELVITGVKTNVPLLRALLADPKVQQGETSIHYLEEIFLPRR
ncbi:acetyl-CoA carboxylase biotin carboxylase subunit [Shewanella halotolerans]|uniref:acetyl-CoA carboxylase biotin carboxylase subunit n=1 Tax=Shewanella halotolerans TaxID=2864204 RepID=UPI001C65DEDE|nr:acetyl-CoA carboxylase biotin carboxylase subunit [Shewanella halotolerans]QYJ92029.1 acetyl-CoA carboxylase biotin carboxylase subunit [Shewanella halotolerans]